MTSSHPAVRVVVVGVCASGKTTLVQDLRQLGLDALSVAQEHSSAPRLWQHPGPDYLVVLDARLETIRSRRRVPWGQERLEAQRWRLRHARDYCWLELATDGLRPAQVAAAVQAALKREGISWERRPRAMPREADVKAHPRVGLYLQAAEDATRGTGLAEQGWHHAEVVSRRAGEILRELGYSEGETQLAACAGLLHDIGVAVARDDQGHLSAVLAKDILEELGFEPEPVLTVLAAVGNHENEAGLPAAPVAAALVLADKTDVRADRLPRGEAFGIAPEDQGNYGVERSELVADGKTRTLVWKLQLNPGACSLSEYFEISLGRIMMCKRAAGVLDAGFEMVINGEKQL